jgi:uncharacterized protein involved in response to NO
MNYFSTSCSSIRVYCETLTFFNQIDLCFVLLRCYSVARSLCVTLVTVICGRILAQCESYNLGRVYVPRKVVRRRALAASITHAVSRYLDKYHIANPAL